MPNNEYTLSDITIYFHQFDNSVTTLDGNNCLLITNLVYNFFKLFTQVW